MSPEGASVSGLTEANWIRTHSASTRNGLPLSTKGVAGSAALPRPTFGTAWTVTAGTSKTSRPRWGHRLPASGVGWLWSCRWSQC